MHQLLKISCGLLLAWPLAARAQDQATTEQVPVTWQSPRPVLEGREAVLHAGERLTLVPGGEICIKHTHKVKSKGSLFWKRKVVIDHHNYRPHSEHPIAVELRTPRGAGTALLVQQTLGAREQLDMPATGAGPRTVGQLHAYIPQLPPDCDGAYKLVVQVDSRPRLQLLRDYLARQSRSTDETLSDDFLDERTCARYGKELAVALLLHARTYYANQPSERADLNRRALELDRENSDAATAVGTDLVASGNFAQAEQATLAAIRLARQQNNLLNLGQNLAGLATVYEKRKLGIAPGELTGADALLAEAITCYEKLATGPGLPAATLKSYQAAWRELLLRRATVLQRIRSLEALQEAIVCLAAARRLPDPTVP